jgi:hypothetical protein
MSCQEKAVADLNQEMESQAHLADQLYWQDISYRSSIDSTVSEDIASSWSSPGDFANDGLHLKFDGQQGTGSLEGISEMLSAGGSHSFVTKLLLTASSVAEPKIELLSAHTESGETDT